MNPMTPEKPRHDGECSTRRTFWVVERFENGKSAGYWDGGSSRSFIPEIENAIQFCRKQDTFWVARHWHWNDVQLTEHIMLDNPATAALGTQEGEDFRRQLLGHLENVACGNASAKETVAYVLDLIGNTKVAAIDATLAEEIRTLRLDLGHAQYLLSRDTQARTIEALRAESLKYAWLRSEAILRGAFKDGIEIDAVYKAARALKEHPNG